MRNPVEESCLASAPGVAVGAERLAQILGASVKRNRHGEHLSLQCWHGVHAQCAPDDAALRLLAPDAQEDVADAQQWLFLDTETTGLAGGTGTYPFLVGLAWWEGGGLEVEQLFMREYSEERSLLAALFNLPRSLLHQHTGISRIKETPNARISQSTAKA